MRCEGDSTLQSGQLELVCLSGREWSGVKPRCVANQPFRPTAGTGQFYQFIFYSIHRIISYNFTQFLLYFTF